MHRLKESFPLGWGPALSGAPVLRPWQEALAVQSRATLGRRPVSELPRGEVRRPHGLLFGKYRTQRAPARGPGLQARRKAVEALLKRHTRVPVLIKALEEETVELSAIETAERARLLEDSEPDIAQRASRLFHSPSGNRMSLIESYRDVIKMAGDRERTEVSFSLRDA